MYACREETFATTCLGKVDMRLELDDISVYMTNEKNNVSLSEKMTQTDLDLLGRERRYSDDDDFEDEDGNFRRTTPNGTSPCNHPSLSCQV